MGVMKATKTMKVGKGTVTVGLGAGHMGGIRRGHAAPAAMTMGAPTPKTQTPGIPKVG